MATIKQLNSYKNIIIKIGSSLIVDESGSIRKKWLSSLVQDVENLKKNSKNVIIVTSGAIALGRNILNLKKNEKLKLDIAIIDSLNANHDKEQFESQVEKLSKENEMLAVKINSHQSMIDQIKTEHQDTIDAYDGAQKEFYLCSSELSKSEEMFENLKD